MRALSLFLGDRAERYPLSRCATLRFRSNPPMDVLLINLSSTGCLFSVEEELVLDEVIRLGIPGIGQRFARVCRIDQIRYACQFHEPISEADVKKASSAETVISVQF